MKTLLASLFVVLVSFSLPLRAIPSDARAAGPPRSAAVRTDVPDYRVSIPSVDQAQGVVLVQVASDVGAEARATLRDQLASLGLTLADTRPDGFPEAGSPQDLRQNVWSLNYDPQIGFAAIRSRVLAWREEDTAERASALLGISPGYVNRDDGTPIYFRPAEVVVMLTPYMAFDRLADSLASMPWLTVAADSLAPPAFAKYVWRRALLNVSPTVGIFAALDSLRRVSWLRAVSPVLVDGGNFLPVIPRVPAMRELAEGTLRKLRPLELVVVAHTCRVDGPDAAVEAARSGLRGVDSLGRIRVMVEVRGAYEDFAPTLQAWGAEILGHEERGTEVVISTLLPCKWLAVCSAIRSVRNIYPFEKPAADD